MGLVSYALGGLTAVVISIAFPKTYQKGVLWIRAFWDKAVEAEKDTPEVK